jgi:hypothetical protein
VPAAAAQVQGQREQEQEKKQDRAPLRADTKTDAARIATLEARVAALENELRQLRTAMQSAGAALTAAAGEEALANRGTNSPRPIRSAGGPSTHYLVPPPSDEERKKISQLSAEGRARFMNEIRGRSDELSMASPERRAVIFKEVLNQVARADFNPGADTKSNPKPNPSPSPTLPAPAPNAPPQATDPTGINALSPSARARFVEELRERQHEIANASPEERDALVKEAMERAQRPAVDPSNNNNNSGSSSNITPPAPAPAPTLDNAGRAPIPSLTTPTSPMPVPMVARDANSAPEAAADATAAAPASAPGTATSTDASRQRFEALSEAQRHRFIEEMRKNREKLANATPAEREVIMHEALTKVEKEAGIGAATAGANAPPATAPIAPAPSPKPEVSQQQQEKKKQNP